MFIQTEPTPNPATVKFLPGRDIMGERPPLDLPDAARASRSPLAAKLFTLDGVKSVFLGRDFVSVTKNEATDWLDLKPVILGAIMDHLSAGQPVLDEENGEQRDEDAHADDDHEIALQIKELLDTRVRPMVAMDGGDIVYHGFDRGVVYLKMRGACAGCPSSTATLKMGIENMLRHFVPEVTEVRQVAESSSPSRPG